MIIVLNGPLGIGKSTLAEALTESIDSCAMISGDSLLAVNPPPANELEYLHATIEVLVNHHRRSGYRHFVIEHVWRSPRELADLHCRLAAIDATADIRSFLLTLPVDENHVASTIAISKGTSARRSARCWRMRRTSVIRSTSRHRRRSSWHECCGILQSHNLDRPCAHMSSSVRMRFRRGPGEEDETGLGRPDRQPRFSVVGRLWNDEEHVDGYLCFIEPRKPVIRRLFRKIETSARVEEVAVALASRVPSRCSRPPLVERERGRHFAMR